MLFDNDQPSKKPLPQLTVITKPITIPSSGKVIPFRPYTTKEEKMLLMAQAADEASRKALQQQALYTVLRNCSQGQFDPEAHPFFDLEYLILQLRALSVGGEATVTLACQKSTETGVCGGKQSITIDLETIQVKKPEGHSNKIILRDQVGVVMQYPRLEELRALFADDVPLAQLALSEPVYAFIRDSIELIFDAEEVYTAADYTTQELDDFLGSFMVSELDPIFEFLRDMPTVEHTVTFTCPTCGNSGPVTFRGVADFLVFARPTTA